MTSAACRKTGKTMERSKVYLGSQTDVLVSPDVLVTGAYGMLASHVIQQLLAAGHVVRGSVRNTSDEARLKLLHALCPDGTRDKLEVVEADLLQPDDWVPAVEGMDYVIHTACPMPEKPEECTQDQIKTAVEGTLNVLNACAEVSSVKRVVYTSGSATIHLSSAPEDKEYTEDDWNETDLETLELLSRSKILAERAFFDFVKNLPEVQKFEFAVLNPGVMLGPLLNHSENHCIAMIKNFLENTHSGLPKLSLIVTDVRDVATAHVQAMTLPEAAGKRHILCSGNIWMSEISSLLNAVFKPLGYTIPSTVIPNTILRVATLLKPSVKAIVPYLGVEVKFDTTRMRGVLGQHEPINMRDSLIDMAHSLVQLGIVPKTDKYSPTRDPAVRERYLSMKLSN